MNQRFLFVPSVALLAAMSLACGSTSPPPGASDGGAQPSVDGGSAPDGGSPADGGSAVDAGTLSHGGVTLSADGMSATLRLDGFEMAPGSEVFKCQTFANPFGADVDIRKFESHMTNGSHHLLLFYEEGATNQPIEDCSGLTFGPLPYGAQRPDTDVVFPDGVAARVGRTQGFKLQVHYLNPSAAVRRPAVELTLHKAVPGTITQQAGVFFFNNLNIIVAPGQTRTVRKTCTLDRDMNMLYAVGHMHKRSTELVATVDGGVIYRTDDWAESPYVRFTPPPFFPRGTRITFACTFVNDTQNYLTFGESADNNEMCIFDGQYYPVPAGLSPMVECD